MESINDVAKKLGYSDAENLERCVESYGEPLGEWWEVIKHLIKKSNDIQNVRMPYRKVWNKWQDLDDDALFGEWLYDKANAS